MKILKLNHELAELVSSGQKTSTWRMFDDKDIRVGDEIELLDKVDPHDRTTWRPIGIGHVSQVIEKRLGDISEDEAAGHEHYASQDDMLESFRKYYGSEVTLETPVKIIHFSFEPLSETAKTVENKTTKITEVKLYADGGSRGNPGPSASGFVLFDMDNNPIHKQGIYLGVTTNNQAEYLALKFGLEEALKQQVQTVHVYMDSLLVVNQMIGKFKVKNRDLWPIHSAIKELVRQFKHVNFTHVPRALNKDADAAVNEALDAEAENNKLEVV